MNDKYIPISMCNTLPHERVGARHCCQVDQKTLIGCEKNAEYVLYNYPYGLEDYTECCEKHVFDLITDAKEHKLIRIAK